ncbi:MAG: 30S ribosomal protein S12 methylthiotransferase RimO [Candidatus Omnitrophota bacterium]|jgi:ribosomal protein S12 methylthiotransferase
MSKTIGIISLGCPRNLSDSERLLSVFTKKGHKFQEDALNADTVIVNTCGFIEDAKRESVDTILRAIDAKNKGSVKKIIVAGCLSERYGAEMAKELKEVDEFRGVLDYNKFFRRGQACLSPAKLTPRHYAYIKISEGCGHRCSYCVIPYLKGGYKSRTIGSLKKEAAALIKKGARELILIGQDTSLYGIDLYGKKKLAELLKELAGISKKVWLRLLYLHPANLDREIIKVIKDNDNICRYIDLPLEHISDKILKQMRRGVDRKRITSFVNYARKEIPGIAIRTSFIAGFPGETDKEFRELLSFIKEMKFERLGVFKYSREEGTPAYDYKGQVPEKEKERRFKALMSLQQEISRGINEKFRGKALKVLIDAKAGSHYEARTEYDAPDIDGMVYVKGRDLKIGNFYNAMITDAYEYDLVGEVS